MKIPTERSTDLLALTDYVLDEIELMGFSNGKLRVQNRPKFCHCIYFNKQSRLIKTP